MSYVPRSASTWRGGTPHCATRGCGPGTRAMDEMLLVMCSRLSVEKRPGTALDALEAWCARGRRAVLVVAGDGPLRARLEQRARERGLPVTFLGHVADRALLGGLQASADVCLAPGPAETFGLAALEAMACGTPVVASASSALPEVVGSAGAVAADSGEAFADAVETLLERPERERREAARARAECFGWDRPRSRRSSPRTKPMCAWGRPSRPVPLVPRNELGRASA